MEGAAVAQVCQEHHTPYVIIRTISDRADQHASIAFTTFAEDVARHYSRNIIAKMFATLNS